MLLRRRLPQLLLIIAVLLVYGRAVHFEFVRYDDAALFYRNPRFNPPTWDGVAYYWTHPFINAYMPLMTSLWGVTAMAAYLPTGATAAERLNPYVFHAMNIALHALAALAAFAGLRALGEAISTDPRLPPAGRRAARGQGAGGGDAGRDDKHATLPDAGREPAGAEARGSDEQSADPVEARGHRTTRIAIAATLSAGVFALHPIQVDPVCWISAMNVPLSGLMCLVATWQYILFARRFPAGMTSSRRRVHYAFGTLALLLAMISKPLSATAPLGIAAIDFWMLRRPLKKVVLSIAPWLALGLGAAVIARSLQISALAQHEPLPITSRMIVAGDAVAFYLRQIVYPLHFAPDYGRTPARVLAQAGWRWALVTGGLTLGLWLIRKRFRGAWTGYCFFIAGLLPTLGLAYFDFQEISTTADRFAYYAMFGFAIALMSILLRVPARATKFAFPAAGVVVALLAVRAGVQVGVWHDTITLFDHALRVNPKSALSHNNLARHLLELGEPLRALPHAQAAATLDPDNYRSQMTLALTLQRSNRLDDAVGAYRDALALNPRLAVAYSQIAAILEQQGQVSASADAYHKALAIDPGNQRAIDGLARLRSSRGTATGPSTTPAPSESWMPDEAEP